MHRHLCEIQLHVLRFGVSLAKLLSAVPGTHLGRFLVLICMPAAARPACLARSLWPLVLVPDQISVLVHVYGLYTCIVLVLVLLIGRTYQLGAPRIPIHACGHVFYSRKKVGRKTPACPTLSSRDSTSCNRAEPSFKDQAGSAERTQSPNQICMRA